MDDGAPNWHAQGPNDRPNPPIVRPIAWRPQFSLDYLLDARTHPDAMIVSDFITD
jgi:hypothetical protein